MAREHPAPVPTLLQLQRGSSGEPTETFGRLYRSQHQHLLQTFSRPEGWVRDAQNQPITPPEDPAEFLKIYLRSGQFEQELAAELFTLLQQAQKTGKVHEFELYDHQLAHMFWGTVAICQGSRSEVNAVLFRNPPGTGKTLELGWFNEGFIHWQQRRAAKGKDPMLGVYCTTKPTHMAQQAFARDQRVYRTPPYTVNEGTIRRYRKDAGLMVGPQFNKLFPPRIWSELFEIRDATRRLGREIIEESLDQRGLLEDFHRSFAVVEAMGGDGQRSGKSERDDDGQANAESTRKSEESLDALAALLDGTRMSVRGIYRNPVLVTPPPLAGEETEVSSYHGDATYAIPEGYPVQAGRPEWMLRELGKRERPRFLLWTKSIVSAVRTRERCRDLLRRAVFFTDDEIASSKPEMYAKAVREAVGCRSPLIIGATGYERPQNLKLWSPSPRHDVTESIEQGILPSVAFEAFPGADKRRYSSGTEEAWEQFRDAHFADVRLIGKLGRGLKQPRDCQTIVVAPRHATREYAHRLQREYAQRSLPGTVLCYDAKTPIEDRNALQLWFMHDEGHPKILVATASEIARALDLCNIENVEIATVVTPEFLYQIFGRLAHSRSSHRVYFRQQLLKESTLTLPRQLQDLLHLPEKGLKWVPLHCLMSKEAYQSDQRRTKGKDWARERKLLPDVGAKRQSRREFEGSPLDTTAPEIRTPLEAAICNTHSRDLTVSKLMEWVATCNHAVTSYHSVPMLAEELLKKARERKLLGDYVLTELRKKVNEIAARQARYHASAQNASGIREYKAYF